MPLWSGRCQGVLRWRAVQQPARSVQERLASLSPLGAFSWVWVSSQRSAVARLAAMPDRSVRTSLAPSRPLAKCPPTTVSSPGTAAHDPQASLSQRSCSFPSVVLSQGFPERLAAGRHLTLGENSRRVSESANLGSVADWLLTSSLVAAGFPLARRWCNVHETTNQKGAARTNAQTQCRVCARHAEIWKAKRVTGTNHEKKKNVRTCCHLLNKKKAFALGGRLARSRNALCVPLGNTLRTARAMTSW